MVCIIFFFNIFSYRKCKSIGKSFMCSKTTKKYSITSQEEEALATNMGIETAKMESIKSLQKVERHGIAYKSHHGKISESVTPIKHTNIRKKCYMELYRGFLFWNKPQESITTLVLYPIQKRNIITTIRLSHVSHAASKNAKGCSKRPKYTI